MGRGDMGRGDRKGGPFFKYSEISSKNVSPGHMSHLCLTLYDARDASASLVK